MGSESGMLIVTVYECWQARLLLEAVHLPTYMICCSERLSTLAKYSGRPCLKEWMTTTYLEVSTLRESLKWTMMTFE